MHDLAMCYIEGAVLDVNFIVSRGLKETENLYTGIGDEGESFSNVRMHMPFNSASSMLMEIKQRHGSSGPV